MSDTFTTVSGQEIQRGYVASLLPTYDTSHDTGDDAPITLLSVVERLDEDTVEIDFYGEAAVPVTSDPAGYGLAIIVRSDWHDYSDVDSDQVDLRTRYFADEEAAQTWAADNYARAVSRGWQTWGDVSASPDTGVAVPATAPLPDLPSLDELLASLLADSEDYAY